MDNESFMQISQFGDKFWRNKKGDLHRLDGPAAEFTYGREEWWKNGKLHRLDGPAVEEKSGYKEWFRNGKYHRLDGPAVETSRGNKFWYQSGKLHRINGPAVIYANGKKEWHIRGCEFKNKEEFFLNLNKEEKKIALFSEDFLNG
jgi:hypothetical protein